MEKHKLWLNLGESVNGFDKVKLYRQTKFSWETEERGIDVWFETSDSPIGLSFAIPIEDARSLHEALGRALAAAAGVAQDATGTLFVAIMEAPPEPAQDTKTESPAEPAQADEGPAF